MSISYFFKISRKADGKTIGEFCYDRIKALNDVYDRSTVLDFDLESIPTLYDGNDKRDRKFDISNVDHDISALEALVDKLENEYYTKKFLLIPNASSANIKEEFEHDIDELDSEINDVKNALVAMHGLRITVENIVENAIDISKSISDEGGMAYKYNAEGLPKTPEGYDPNIWVGQVDILAYAS